MAPHPDATVQGKHLTVIGCGGNIGSHLVGHLARMPGVTRITLIDKDSYEEKNLASQNIALMDVGKPKAEVQAGRLREIGPHLHIEAIHAPVEAVPLGLLRCDMILTGLDSRLSRQYVNEASWRLGVPWLDAGVMADGLLARVVAYEPSLDAPCIECGWDADAYESLEQRYQCKGAEQLVAPTDAPSCLGALAASLEAIECLKRLNGCKGEPAAEAVFAAASRKFYLTRLRRNPECRFDHRTWRISPLRQPPEKMTLGDALGLGDAPLPGDAVPTLRVQGSVFVNRLHCPKCGPKPVPLALVCPHGAAPECKTCGERMLISGMDMMDALQADAVAPGDLRRPLKSIGFRNGDVFSVRRGSKERHYVVQF